MPLQLMQDKTDLSAEHFPLILSEKPFIIFNIFINIYW